METQDGKLVIKGKGASKTSLEGWKLDRWNDIRNPGGYLKNFLRGMETRKV